MNLRRQAISYFKDTRARPEYWETFRFTAEELAGPGESFLMPYGGYLFDADKEASIDISDLHLPFNVCVLEWRKKEEGVGDVEVICIAREFDDHFEIEPVARMAGTWHPLVLVLKVPKAQLIETFWNGSGFMNRVSAEPISLSPFAPPELLDGSNYLHEVKVVAQFLVAANCGNVSPIKVLEPTAKQIKATKARGNPPFNSYWVLDCCLDGSADIVRSNARTHTTPRLHVRRGHIRRLPSGKLTWVRQCTVGDLSLGKVEKTYRVNPSQRADTA